jgi:hypothetical protein
MLVEWPFFGNSNLRNGAPDLCECASKPELADVDPVYRRQWSRTPHQKHPAQS